MLIVDAQCHIWAASTPERPWPARHKPHRPEPFSKDDMLAEMNKAGVDRAIIVPPSWEGDRNDLALEATRLHPDRFAALGVLELQSPAARGLMATWRQQPGMLGVRLAVRQPPHNALLNEGKLDWLWKEAEQAGVPIAIMVDPKQLPHVEQVATRYPGLKLTLDHLSLHAGQKDEAAFADLDQVLKLASKPNVAVKVTALPTYTDDSPPFRRLHPYIRRVYDKFGPKRMFWGTDITRMPCTYNQAITMVTEGWDWLTPEDKEWIMGRGVCTWLGWKMPGA